MKYVLSALIGAFICFIGLGLSDEDGILGLVGKLFFENQTRFTINYSESEFFKLELGTSKKDVVGIIGEPFRWSSENNGLVIGAWTTPCCGGNYLNRVLMFRDDLLVEKFNEYYWD